MQNAVQNVLFSVRKGGLLHRWSLGQVRLYIDYVYGHYIILYYIILYYIILYYTILYYTMLCYAMLCYVMLCYAMLYYTILYYIILYYIILDTEAAVISMLCLPVAIYHLFLHCMQQSNIFAL